MTNTEVKEFAIKLAKAETEQEVIDILRKVGYWDNDSVWCEYGGDSMNYSTIGNQQTSAANALVEKLVNSVDAVLMRECLKQKIDPSSNQAPRSITEAQRKFFNISNGKLSNINTRQRARLAEENIWLVATGSKTKPSLSIIDKGEGQSPKRVPETILSLTKENKKKIPFVQGKFGMGGSGVLRFCNPKNSVMLIISKRSHEIDLETDANFYGEDNTQDLWGVTIARREDPKDNEKSSHYTYLAPGGEILSFISDELPLLPGPHQKTFHGPLKSGTFIKLYEYDIGSNLTSLIVLNLYYRLALLLPDIALPIRMAEHRNYRANSYNITLAGLSVRLKEDSRENLEPEFQTPGTGEMTVEGQKLGYSIYVFKKDKKETNYAKREGVVFSINGQAHGFLSKDFFKRNNVGMSYLSDSILVTVDCSEMSRRKQEELFMPSRDRLANASICDLIKRELEDIIKNHSGLRKLRNKRREEAVNENLKDSKTFKDALEDIIKKSPPLTSFFLLGESITNPFNMEGTTTQKEFKGEEFPSFFSPAKEYTEKNPKIWPINNRKLRVKYETDAKNDYFNRNKDPGKWTLEHNDKAVQNCSFDLFNGLATLEISVPKDAEVGDTLCFEVKIDDVSQRTPFTSRLFCTLVEKAEQTNGSKVKSKKGDSPGKEKGKDRQRASHLAMPPITDIGKTIGIKTITKTSPLTNTVL